MLPRVIIHNAISADGRTDWFTPDIERFYDLTSTWTEDATLAGSETLLAAYQGVEIPEDSDFTSEYTGISKDDSRPILVVPDSRGRLRFWNLLKKEEYWKGIVVLCTQKTPEKYLQYLKGKNIEVIIAGEDKVDFRAALEELNTRFGVNTVRVDSGGTLNGVLLRAGLVNEVSILIHPFLVGGTSPHSIFKAPDLDSKDGVIPLKYLALKREGDLFWFRFEIEKPVEEESVTEGVETGKTQAGQSGS
jgi:2,5-diamino-6-(ribosylamino)-4(3H)-pyrimidinone 5'-phosphate reductase